MDLIRTCSWDKIDFLITKMRQAHALVTADIGRFMAFVRELRG